MIPLIEGVELKGLTAPFKNTGKPVNIDAFNLDWGQFVGPIPSKLRLALKMAAPLDASDPGQMLLVAAGIDKAGDRPRSRRGLDRGVTRLRPRTCHARPRRPRQGIGAGVARQRAARGILRRTPYRPPAMAGQIEAGAIEFTLRDTGGIDLAVAQ